jgi:hypothetical protein
MKPLQPSHIFTPVQVGEAEDERLLPQRRGGEGRRGERRERGEGERERGVVRRTEPNPNSVLLSLQEEESFSTIFEGYMTENYVRSFVFETYISLVNESKSRC